MSCQKHRGGAGTAQFLLWGRGGGSFGFQLGSVLQKDERKDFSATLQSAEVTMLASRNMSCSLTEATADPSGSVNVELHGEKSLSNHFITDRSS